MYVNTCKKLTEHSKWRLNVFSLIFLGVGGMGLVYLRATLTWIYLLFVYFLREDVGCELRDENLT